MDKIFKKLIGNTLIFAIGNGSTFLFSFFMIPVYTSVLTRTSFGISDLIITTVSMLLPLVSLNIHTAIFRWALDENTDKREIFSNGIYLGGTTSAVTFIFALIFLGFHLYNIAAIAFNLSATILLNFFQNFFRGSNQLVLYSISGTLAALVNALLNVLLMLIYNFGLAGYLISLIISNYIAVIFLIIAGKAWIYWSNCLISYAKIREMLKFSIPMIPNAFTWWMTNDVSRILILIFIGPAGNGLYAVSNKLPSMLFTLFSLFHSAWQIISVKTAREKEVERIYSITFNTVVSIMIFTSTIIVSVLKVFMNYYVAYTYYEAWKLIPVLLITAMLSNISVFLGTTYTVAKETKGLFTTTVWGTFINLIMCCILIPIFGVQGAGISGCLGFLAVSLIRLKQTAKWVKIRINWKFHMMLSLGYFIVSVNLYINSEPLLINICTLTVMSVFLIMGRRKIKLII